MKPLKDENLPVFEDRCHLEILPNVDSSELKARSNKSTTLTSKAWLRWSSWLVVVFASKP